MKGSVVMKIKFTEDEYFVLFGSLASRNSELLRHLSTLKAGSFEYLCVCSDLRVVAALMNRLSNEYEKLPTF